MHVPDHFSVLPEHLDPMLMPDMPAERHNLLSLLELGYYIMYEEVGKQPGLNLTEAEIRVRAV